MSDDERADELDAAAQYRALAAVARDVIVTIDADSTVRFVNSAVEDVFGYTPAELQGRSLTRLMDDERAARHEDGLARYLRTGERRHDWGYVELTGRHRDGSAVPLGVSVSEFTHDGERLFTGIVRDISDRKRLERRLTTLNEVSRALAERTTPEDVWERVCAGATDVFPDHEVALAAFDADRGRLTLAAASPGFPDGEDGLAGLDDLAWEAFTANTVTTASTGGALPPETPFTRVHVQPLGRYGVLLTATAAAVDAPVATTHVELAGLLADRTTTAFERLARERDLERRNDLLAERNETLARVSRLNDIIRRLTAGLVDATTRDEVEARVCRELAASDPIEWCWFGVPDPVSGTFEVRAHGGDDRGYLEWLTVSIDGDGTDPGPTERAGRTREVHVEDGLHTDPPYGAWRNATLERGFGAVAAVPIDHETAHFGVLTLYVDEPGAFGHMERAVLAELGEMIGYAINAVERRNALVDEGAVELEFRVTDADLDLIQFVRETGARFEFETVIADPDGTLRVFFSVDGASPETTREFALRSRSITDLHLVTGDADSEARLYEAWITDNGPIGTLLGLNAVPREITATGEEAWFTVELPRSVDIREFVAALERAYDGIDLAARRERDRPIQTRGEFRERLEERLTARQLSALETAYWSGYFEWPRTRTGREIAETLDISQPTFTRHLRSGEQKLLSLLLEGADA
jgi:PAS domain S-box-containing protein